MSAHHPLNQGFRWQPHAGPYRLISDAHAKQYDELGFFLLEGVFSDAEIAEVREAIDPLEAEYEQRLRDEHGGRALIARAGEITFTTHLVTRSPMLARFSRHPKLVDLCHDTLGPGVRLYWDQSVYKKPGNPEEFPWHQDNGYAFVQPQQYLTCWIPLSPATVDNGCPWVAPGRHQHGTLEHSFDGNGLRCLESVEDAVAVPAAVGDVVVFSSLTPHRTGPNLTGGVRKSYILQYAPEGAVIHTREGEIIRADDAARQYRID